MDITRKSGIWSVGILSQREFRGGSVMLLLFLESGRNLASKGVSSIVVAVVLTSCYAVVGDRIL